MRNKVKDPKVYKLAREREPVLRYEEAKAGDHALLTLHIDGIRDREVHVKVWDGEPVYIWEGAIWSVVRAIKTSAYEESNTSPLWWSTFSWRE